MTCGLYSGVNGQKIEEADMQSWIPTTALSFATPGAFPRGSLIFYPPFYKKRDTPAPALRFDVIEQGGKVHPWVFWLQGGPWGAEKYIGATQTATLVQGMSGADRTIPGIQPNSALQITIELSALSKTIHDSSWSDAGGAIATTSSGLFIAAAEHNHGHHPVPIDLETWTYSDDAMSKPVACWYSDWRIKLIDANGDVATTLDFLPPLG